MNYVVIFAGGVGSRMGSALPKQFLEIDDKPIIAYTIEKFNNSNLVDAIVIVTLSNYVERVKEIVSKHSFKKVVFVTEGGDTAFASQFNGIKFLTSISKSEEDIVLIHDGVRPLINEELIQKCIEGVKEKGSAITVSPAFETIALVDSDRQINRTVPRQDCLIARAPQAFYLEDLYNAHIRAKKDNKVYIDSASMMLDQGISLNPIIGPDENIKITTQYDYQIAALLIRDRK